MFEFVKKRRRRENGCCLHWQFCNFRLGREGKPQGPEYLGLVFVRAGQAGVALAVAARGVEVDLRELIWSHYQLPIHDIIREQRQALTILEDSILGGGDPPF